MIGEALADLPGPVQALIPSRSTQHHFTLADQVDQLVRASETTPDLGFMARTMALCSLPRSNPGNRKEYVRRNGPYKLGMTAGIDNKLPYGNLPRLILAWVCSEAVRTQSREIVLGRSLSKFMRALGINSTSGGSPHPLAEPDGAAVSMSCSVRPRTRARKTIRVLTDRRSGGVLVERAPTRRAGAAGAARLSMGKGTASTRRRPAESWSSRSSRLWRNSNES